MPALMLCVVVGAAILCLAAALFMQRESEDVAQMASCPPPGRFVFLPCGRTHVVVEGPESGDTVVLVPGATLSLGVWQELPAALVRQGYRVLRFDLLGRGLSDRPRLRYDADLFDTQLTQLLDRMAGTRPVHLVGLAFGCLIGAEFARRHPRRVQSLALLGPDGFGVSMTTGDRIRQWPGVGDVLVRCIGNRRLMARLDTYTAQAPILAWLRALLAAELKRKGFKRALLSSIRHMPIHDARSLYRGVDGAAPPMRVVWGACDAITPVPDGAVLRGTFLRASVQVLPAVGHLPHVEALEQTVALLCELFRSKQPSQAG